MKKYYQKPQMEAVMLQHQVRILSGSLQSVDGNADITFGGGGSGTARSRGYDAFDDDDY